MKKQLQCLLVVCLGVSGFRAVDRTVELPKQMTLATGERLDVVAGENYKIIPREIAGIETDSCQITFTGQTNFGENRLKVELDRLQCGDKLAEIQGYIIDKRDNLMDILIPYPGAEIIPVGSKFEIILTGELKVGGMTLSQIRS